MHEEGDKPLKIVNPKLIALKPRQILLAEQQHRGRHLTECGPIMVTKKQQPDTNNGSQKPEVKPAVLHSILNYLYKNEFSKSLKRLLKEAEIKSDDWKTTSDDLEDIYLRYAVHCQNSDVKIKGHIEQDANAEKGAGDVHAAEEISSKKKKTDTKKEEIYQNAVSANCEPIIQSKSVDSDNSPTKEKKQKKFFSNSVGESKDDTNNIIGELKGDKSKKELKVKSKKESRALSQPLDHKVMDTEVLPVVAEKKPASSEVANGLDEISKEAGKVSRKERTKLKSVALVEDGQEDKVNTVAKDAGTDIPNGDLKAKFKEKKKKKEVVVPESKESESIEKAKSSENGAKKKSKKRKKSASADAENQPVEDMVNSEPKRRRTDEGSDGYTSRSVEENLKDTQTVCQKSSAKEVNEGIKEDQSKNGVQESTEQKSGRKQPHSSSETRTAANAFKRVKVEEVKYFDQRLQDNSYWAKDGAEYGYGAKAQEVLGQVKGRDFRHEKTKKKRGSYRGGVIDFQSHSIKFNDSDEE